MVKIVRKTEKSENRTICSLKKVENVNEQVIYLALVLQLCIPVYNSIINRLPFHTLQQVVETRIKIKQFFE